MNIENERSKEKKEESQINLRKILINEYESSEHKKKYKSKQNFPDNRIKTAKYNAFTFLPLAIIYQFNNYFNVFFLITAILSSIPYISPINPGAAIGPFLFVIVVSLIREAIEDYKKTKFDKYSNNLPSFIWNRTKKEFEKKKWANIHVGDIIRVDKNDMIPSDVIILKSSKESGFCYLETTNLDGESALKPREALIISNSLIRSERDLNLIQGYVEVDLPNKDIYNVEGTIFLKSFERCNFDINNVLLRGGRLKNVDYVYGLSLYTGKDSKIMKNIKHGSLKRSTIDIKLNKIVIYISILVLVLCIICTILGSLWRNSNMPNYILHQFEADYVLYYNPASDQIRDNTLDTIRIFASFFIIYSTLIPISLMITYQVLKGLQMLVIEGDRLLSEGDDKMKALSMNLHEDLGMVKYILTDKTGTLTVNEMKFYACSIFCKLYDNEDEVDVENEMNDEEELEKELDQEAYNQCRNVKDIDKNFYENAELDDDIRDSQEHMTMNINPPNIYPNYNRLKYNIPIDNIKYFSTEKKKFNPNTYEKVNSKNRRNSNESANTKRNTGNTNQTTEPVFKSSIASSLDKNKIIEGFHKQIPLKKYFVNPKFSTLSEAVLEFFLNISLNHNVLTETDINTGEKIYQGVNPDEVTLVKTAAELGIEFIDRHNNYITVKILGKIESFEVIQKFDFTSVRMRSSIIVRDSSGKLKLYMKGADTKILEKLDDFSINNLKEKSKAHLDLFAKRGLRTLCYSLKILDEDNFYLWESLYKEMKYKSINNKALLIKVEEIISKLEDNMMLLGVSALEDKLQDGVKDDLKSFIEAGISVWMLTGDKMNTAESIGYSCKLFNKDTEVFKIKKGTKEETSRRLYEILEKMAFTEKELEEYKNKHTNQILNTNKENLAANGPVDIGNNYIKSNDKIENENDIIAQNKIFVPQLFYSNQMPNLKVDDVQIEIVENRKDSKSNLDSKSGNYGIDLENFQLDAVMKESTIENINNNLTKVNHTPDKNVINSTQIMPLNIKNKNMISENNSSNNDNNQINDNDILNFMKEKSFYDFSSRQGIDEYSEINKIIGKESIDSEYEKGKEEDGHIENFNNPKKIKLKVNKSLYPTTIKNNKKSVQVLKNPLGKTVFHPAQRNSSMDHKLNIPELLNFYEQQLDELHQNNNKKLIPNFSFKKSKIISSDKKNLLINFGIIIEGESISHCLNGDDTELFWQLIKKSRSVIACRCSPFQKAQIVSFIQSQSKDITLAIGDGGNDVNMIKTANVGIGIFGKEGYQAAYNSDFAISQFKYLKRLLYFHGRYSLERNSYYSYFFFFKNVIFTLPQFWLVFFTGFSGLNFYDDWYYLGFNSFLTALPIAARTLINEDIDLDTEKFPFKFSPDIYKEYRDSVPFSLIKFSLVFLSSMLYSAIIFFIPLIVFHYGFFILGSFIMFVPGNFDNTLPDNHRRHTFIYMADLVGIWVKFVHYIKLISLQIFVNIIFITGNDLRNSGQISGITLDIVSSLIFWITLLLTCAVCYFPFLILRRCDLHFSDDIINNIRQQNYEYNFIKKSLANKLEDVTKNLRHIVKFKKILQGEDLEYDNYANKKVKELVDLFKDKRKKTTSSIKNIQKKTVSDTESKKKYKEENLDTKKC